MASAPTPDVRLAWFGALLGRETGLDIEIVGGSAIELYLTSRAYISEDVDLVGSREPIARVLHRWGFQEVEGRSARTYWKKEGVGLVDLVGPTDRSGLPPIRRETPHGPVWVSPVEPLILRRLLRAAREGSEDLFAQAVALARGRDVDWDYLESMSEYEGVTQELERLRAVLRRERR